MHAPTLPGTCVVATVHHKLSVFAVQIEAEAARNPHRPQLSARSAAYVPAGPAKAGDRLFQQAKQQAAKRDMMQKAKEMTDALFDPETGEELFKPRLNPRSKPAGRAGTSGRADTRPKHTCKYRLCHERALMFQQ